MAKDNGGAPGAETSTFSPSEHTIHCVAKLGEAKDGTKVTFSWWAVDTEGSKDQKIKELDYTTKGAENIVHAHLTKPDDWPKRFVNLARNKVTRTCAWDFVIL